jgi:hypothetical protein
MSQIIAFSGKKGSGKNTACNFIIGHCMISLNICQEFKITPLGELWVSDLFGDLEQQGIFNVMSGSDEMNRFLETHLSQYVKLYSFADLLKRTVCMDILGLTFEQCFGTDEQKNSPTKLKWEDMPGVITEVPPEGSEPIIGRLGPYYEKLKNGTVYHNPGQMTAREIMQFVGTEIFRKMYGNVWVDATIRRIRKDDPAIALICDLRFPNEADGVLDEGGYVCRFNRAVNPNDTHESETALDNYTRFSKEVDNKDMSIPDQNVEVYNILVELGLVGELEPETKEYSEHEE